MNVQSRYEKYRWKQIFFLITKTSHCRLSVLSMKKIQIHFQELLIDENQFDMYKEFLTVLHIKHEVRKIIQPGNKLTLKKVINDFKYIKSVNVVYFLAKDLDMPVEDFIKSFSRLDVLSIRNVGKKTLQDIIDVFQKYEYYW